MSVLRRRSRELPIPNRPYKGSAILYAAMAAVIVVVAVLTGAELVRTLVAAVLFFVVATAWSWFRFRQRIRARDAQDRQLAEPRGDANGRRKERS